MRITQFSAEFLKFNYRVRQQKFEVGHLFVLTTRAAHRTSTFYDFPGNHRWHLAGLSFFTIIASRKSRPTE